MSKNLKFSLRMNRPATAGMWYTMTAVLERGTSLLFTPIYTRLLQPQEYGIYSLYTSFMGIFTVFAAIGLSGSPIYKGLREFSGKERFISSALGLQLTASAVFISVYLVFFNFFDRISGLGFRLTVLLLLQVALDGARAIRLSEAKYNYSYRLSLTEGILFSMGAPLLSVLLILVSSEPELSRIYALLAVSLVFTTPLAFKMLKRGKFKLYSRPVWSFLLKYTIPTLPHYISMALIWQIGKILVGKYFSSAETAMLSLAISIGFIPSLFTLGAQNAIIPWINKKLDTDAQAEKKIYVLISEIFVALTIVIALFISFAPEILRIVASEQYLSALPAVYPIAVCVGVNFLINIFSSMISYYKKTYLVTVGSVCGAALALILNLLFTKRLGFVFSATAQIPVCLLILFIYIAILKRNMGHSELLLPRLFSYLVFMIIASLILAFIAHSFAARLVFSAALILLLLPKAKTLAVFVK